LPHDAKAETLAAPRSAQAQFKILGFRSRIVPSRDVQDGIQAARLTLKQCTIDADACAVGLEALAEYHRTWDVESRAFAARPLHNWASNGADAFRYASIAWREDRKPEPKAEPRFHLQAGVHYPTFDEVRGIVARRHTEN
jgi:phage terminase large subunit